MKMLDVALVGTGGMMPMPGRFLSSMLLRQEGRLYLVDCGEGTQVSMKQLGWGFKAIEAILFTHYHADHISGLPGLLLTIGNAGRTEPVTLVGPKGLREVVEGLRRIAPELPFPIIYKVLEEQEDTMFSLGELSVRFLPVEHLVKCYAYRFDLSRKGRFDANKAKENGVPKSCWSRLQKNGVVTENGVTYTADLILGEARRGLSLSYCTDSRPVNRLVEFIKDSDLFVCEGMYGSDEKKSKAVENKHMLFSEAAALARAGNVKRLWLTHYSPSLSDPQEFYAVAAGIFENTTLGFDRMTDALLFDKEEAL